MRTKSSFLLLSIVLISTGSCLADPTPDWPTLSQRTRARMMEMDEILRDSDAQRSYDNYLNIFSTSIKAYGLYETGATNIVGLRKHYLPVFFELKDGVILSDEIIVAGNMAAQRYHSLLYLEGEFDGVKASKQPVFLRGQTFFRFDTNNRIAERWSNHDHEFRLGQLKGAEGAAEGRRIAAVLNGPGLSEPDVREKLEAMTNAFNRMQAPAEREIRYMEFFDPGLIVHGLSTAPAGLQQLREYLVEIWSAFPDLERTDEARLAAWSFGAVRWRALGSHRKRYRDSEPTMRPVTLRGETILHFNGEGRIDEIWLNNGPID